MSSAAASRSSTTQWGTTRYKGRLQSTVMIQCHWRTLAMGSLPRVQNSAHEIIIRLTSRTRARNLWFLIRYCTQAKTSGSHRVKDRLLSKKLLRSYEISSLHQANLQTIISRSLQAIQTPFNRKTSSEISNNFRKSRCWHGGRKLQKFTKHSKDWNQRQQVRQQKSM